MRILKNSAAVIGSVREHQLTSIHRRSQQLNFSKTSLRRILYKDFGMTPYKVQLIQELRPIDHPISFNFAKWAAIDCTEDVEFGKKNHFFI